jgi:hypothetical protein
MVSATDYPSKPGIRHSHDTASERPRKRRFRLFAALAAPFQDMDERALHKKKQSHGPLRNNSKGNLFTSGAAAPVQAPVRRFPRGGD